MSRREAARRAVFLLLVLGVAAVGVWAGQEFHRWRAGPGGAGSAGTAIDSDLVAGARFPSVSVAEPDGPPRDTAELTAGGALVLFLRSDCPACGLTVERWVRETASGDLAGVPVVGITTEPPAAIPAYRREAGIPFPVYSDSGRAFVERHGVTAVPYVVAVAPGGRIRDRLVGHREDADLARLARLASP